MESATQSIMNLKNDTIVCTKLSKVVKNKVS